jgi:hypothetical protein
MEEQLRQYNGEHSLGLQSNEIKILATYAAGGPFRIAD